jgi:hypothetical protein
MSRIGSTSKRSAARSTSYTIDDFEITVEPRGPSAEEYARLREEVMRSATRVSGARTPPPAKEHSRGRATTGPGR